MNKIKYFSLGNKLLLLVILPVIFCTGIAILIASFQLRDKGQKGLEEKSKAVLSQMDAVRKFIGQQGMLDETIKQIKKDSSTSIDEQLKRKIKNQVPILASMEIGEDDAEKDHYQFRVATLHARNPKNQAVGKEIEFINQLENGRDTTITYIDKESNTIWVMSPIFLHENQGCMACHGNPANSPFGDGKDILGYSMENWKEGDIRGIFKIVSDLKPIQNDVNKAILSISIWGILLCAIAILIGIVFIRKILGTFKQIIKVSQKVAEGDLNYTVQVVRHDELGEIAFYINKMVSALNRILLIVRDSSEKLAAATKEISVTSNSISNGAQTQASEFEELSSSVQSTADNSSHANVVTAKSAKNANEAGTGMDNSIQAMDEIRESSKKISVAIQIISDIAFQTNLLALNAAVEAARAGIHGKGFGVVASEVKKLAEKSSVAAKQIKEVILTSLNFVEKGVNVSKEAGVKIQEIIQDINQTAKELQMISAASQEQAITMEKNTEIIASNAASAQQLAASADSLAAQANYLSLFVRNFKLNNEV
jgi:methyl-accepting chemotaxis protein